MPPPKVQPKSVVPGLTLADGCTYTFEVKGNWVIMTFLAPLGSLFADNRKSFLQVLHWVHAYGRTSEYDFLARAFALRANGLVDDPRAEQPT